MFIGPEPVLDIFLSCGLILDTTVKEYFRLASGKLNPGYSENMSTANLDLY